MTSAFGVIGVFGVAVAKILRSGNQRHRDQQRLHPSLSEGTSNLDVFLMKYKAAQMAIQRQER
jgi:hypothetical protein